MRHVLWLAICFFTLSAAMAQNIPGPVAWYPFDNGFEDATGNTSNAGVPLGNPGFACGVHESALALNGGNDIIRFVGPVIEEFSTEDFSVVFYFKPVGREGTQYLLEKRPTDCTNDRAFFVRYQPATRNINIVLQEGTGRSINMVSQLPAGFCWYQIAIVRDGGRVRLYVNGDFVREQGTVGRIDLMNDGDLLLGGSNNCYGPNEVAFRGLIDDLRVYNLALDDREVDLLYSAPDRIATQDTVIFLGSSVDISLTSTCATFFQWTPNEGVFGPGRGEPTITPSRPGDVTYNLQMTDGATGCVATDSIRITVVDPSTLDCSTAYLPKAFTPNGDGLNDTYGLSNPNAFQQFTALEIYDRFGARVFSTGSPFTRWDGSYRGEPVNPGMMLYRVRFVCNGEEVEQSGSFVVMR